mmetsp:Transcript_20820/g.29387  ORF Transcript_20820/g.29387 Transcript_20820/m.29387 type:complete len:149 (+) Transcript_20820:44-490(+)
MKSSLLLLVALFLFANTASAAEKTSLKVRGTRKNHPNRKLKVKDECVKKDGSRRRTKKCDKEPKDKVDKVDKEPDTDTETEEADEIEIEIEGLGSTADGFEDENVTRSGESDITELNSEEPTSSGNKFFNQESSIAIGAILATGLGFL